MGGAGREQQRSRPPPAAETGRRGWGRVLIFQSPVKGLRKNQQTQLVRAAHLSYSFFRNVYQESTACRSTVCRTSVHAVPDRNNVRQSHSQKTKAGYHRSGGILPFSHLGWSFGWRYGILGSTNRNLKGENSCIR